MTPAGIRVRSRRSRDARYAAAILLLFACLPAGALAAPSVPIDSLASRRFDPPADFAGFRIPEQHWRRWSVSSSSGAHLSSGDSQGRGYSSASRYRDANGYLTGSLEDGRDSDRLQHVWRAEVSASGRVDFSHDRSTSISSDGGAASERTADGRREVYALFSASDALRWYPGRGWLGLATNVAASRHHDRVWDHQSRWDAASDTLGTSSSIASDDARYREYDEDVSATIGIVFGRVRDATPVDVVWQLERRWSADGTLARPLSTAARQRLVGLFAVRGRYSVPHGYPEKAFWRDVEAVVREDGALTGDHLAAYGVKHAGDPLPYTGEPFDTRLVGWSIGPTFSVRQFHLVGHTDRSMSETATTDTLSVSTASHSYQRGSISNDVLRIGVSGEFHRPLGIRWQLDASASASGDPKGLRRSSGTGAGVSLRYRIAERWFATAGGSGSRDLSRFQDVSSYSSGIQVRYQIEDHWSLSATVGSRQHRYIQGDWRNASHDTGVSLGVDYGSGRFDAPGLIAPVRPLPVGLP